MNSKVLSQIAGLLVSVMLTACGGGGGGGSTPAGDPQNPGNTTPQGQVPVVQYEMKATLAGAGSVQSVPWGISCTSTSSISCSANFDTGTAVTLTATPASGYQFTGWGGACTGTSTCSLTMSAAKLVTANFAQTPAQVVTPTLALTTFVSGSGSITGTATGVSINCATSVCTKEINKDTVVSLSAVPATGWVFSGWSGACTGTAACSVTMSAAKAVTATFVETKVLTTAISGSGSVVGASVGVSCTSSTCTKAITVNTLVTLSATPAMGSTFSGWSGACAGTSTCSVTMSAAQSVTATFLPTQVLTTTVSGSGSITGSNAVSCSSGSCTKAISQGTVVSLTATPATGYALSGWSGACTGTGACSVTMSAAQSVTATFLPTQVLTTTVSGSGSITGSNAVSCSSGSCTKAVSQGTVVSLTATPATSYTFSGWSGACTGTGACSVTMSAAQGVTATFVAATVPQTLTTVVSGSGSIVGASAGVSCSSGTCTKAITQGTVVALTATPASGYTFSSWSGACTGTGACSVTMSQTRSVTATFAVAASVAGGCVIPRGSSSVPAFASAHPKVFVNHTATLSCLQQLLSTKAASATRFKSYVDSEIASPGSNWEFQYWWSALMYQVTGTTSYADFAIAKVDAFVASEEAKIAAGQAPEVAGDSYLEVGRLVGDVALVYDWCYSRLTTTQRTRWIAYMNKAVSNVWNPDTANWGGRTMAWSGWSVNNPSNNYYYSFLRATMLVGLATRSENSSAQAWIDKFRTAKISNELVPTFNRDLVGGGSREGTGYGTAMMELFRIYDWWERSTGERIATLTPHTLSSTAWLAHNIVPTLDRLAATGDQARDSSVELFDYHRAYLLGLITLFPQERLSSISKILLDGSSVPKMGSSFQSYVDYLYQPPALPSASIGDLSSTYWGSGTGQLLMRSAWGDKNAAFSTLACGPFTESHAHRDQGSFQLYRGEWLAPTANIYSASGIEQQEELNNLVRVELSGKTIRQVDSTGQCNLTALADNSTYTYGVAKITPVYNGHASISKVEREYLFIKPSTFVVFDRVGSASGTRRIWTLNLPGVPVVSGDRLTYTGATANKLDVYRVAPSGLAYTVNRPVMESSVTNASARRVDVVDTAGTQSNFLHVMGTNSSVTSATRSDATGQTGVQIVLADGRTVTVRFGNTTSGGTIDVRNAGGGTVITGALPTTVTAPPLFRN